jgi:DNA-binding beta-propeller fold protein YncE
MQQQLFTVQDPLHVRKQSTGAWLLLTFTSATGMPQYDPVAKKVYVNLQDQNIFAVIDPANDEVAGRYPVGRCKETTA